MGAMTVWYRGFIRCAECCKIHCMAGSRLGFVIECDCGNLVHVITRKGAVTK